MVMWRSFIRQCTKRLANLAIPWHLPVNPQPSFCILDGRSGNRLTVFEISDDSAVINNHEGEFAFAIAADRAATDANDVEVAIQLSDVGRMPAAVLEQPVRTLRVTRLFAGANNLRNEDVQDNRNRQSDGNWIKDGFAQVLPHNDQANPAGMAPSDADFTLEPDRHSRSGSAPGSTACGPSQPFALRLWLSAEVSSRKTYGPSHVPPRFESLHDQADLNGYMPGD